MILLPEEWFSKYANLLEMGVQTEQGIRLKHTFIGAAQAALGGTGLKKFSGKNQIKNVSVPKALKATLRPYQQKGFSWMMHLHKLGFGGCLADDMGKLSRHLRCYNIYINRPPQGKQPLSSSFLRRCCTTGDGKRNALQRFQ